MHAELQHGSQLIRASRDSFHAGLATMKGPNLSTPSLSNAKSIGTHRAHQGLSGVMSRNETEIPRRSSFVPTRSFASSQLQQKASWLSTFSDSSLCSTSFEGRNKSSAALLRLMFVLVSCCRVDKVVDCAVGFLQRHIHHMPFLLRFKFIRVLVKKAKDSVQDSLAAMTSPSSFEAPANGRMSNKEFETISSSEDATSPATVLSSLEDDPDDYGFFADFDEDNSFLEEKYQFQSYVWTRDSRLTNSLCTLEEVEE